MRNRTEQNGIPATQAATDIARASAANRYARVVALQNDNVDALARLHEIFRDGAVELSNDLLEFAPRHVQGRANDAGWRVDHAAPLEAAAAHLRRCQGFAEQALEQTARFLNLMAKVSRDSRLHLEDHAATMLGHLRDEGSFASAESSARALPEERRDRR